MLKKLCLFAAIMVLGASMVAAQCSKEGDPGFFYGFPDGVQQIFPGQTLCFTPAPTNFGWVSGTCMAMDTLCMHGWSAKGWTFSIVEGSGDPDIEECFELGSSYWIPGYQFCVTALCATSIGEYDTVIGTFAFCDTNMVCAPECGDCEDPNYYGGNPYYSADTLIFVVVTAPPALFVMQDSLFEITYGQTAAYVPFDVCNGDPCAAPTLYGYAITAAGVNIPGSQSGVTVTVAGGECEQVYWIGDAGATPPCTYETLTIIAWTTSPPIVYDTCVQLVHVIESKSVPLFTAPVVTILVLAMILTAAVFMRRRAASRA